MVWGTSSLRLVILISIKLILSSVFKNKIEKKMRNFPHCFFATQGGRKRTNEKEPYKTWQRGADWPLLLLYVDKMHVEGSGELCPPDIDMCFFKSLQILF